MDSGSSGSMQSSSGGGVGGDRGGGDEEYDSRNESLSSFLNHRHNQSSTRFSTSIANQQPPLLSHQPTFFDPPTSQNLDHIFSQNATLQYNNNDQLGNWSRTLRSEANYGDFGSLKSSSPSSLGTSSQAQLGSSSSQPVEPNVTKNPKKRTRASRRAPTTVLTTDTANFRQMVQEFTGIQTSPFTSTTSSYSRRLDLFSTAGSTMRAGQLDTLGSSLYPSLRPSLQKAQQSTPSPSLFNSSVINAMLPNNNNPIGTTTTTNNNNIISQVPLNLCNITKQPQNLLNMQNQFLAFQPNLHSSSMKLPMPSLDELGMSHQQATNHEDNIARWRDGGRRQQQQQQQQLGCFDGNDENGQNIINSFKLNSSSSSDFNPDKVLDNASSGGLEFRNYN